MDRSGGGEKVKEKGRDRDVGLNGRGEVRAGQVVQGGQHQTTKVDRGRRTLDNAKWKARRDVRRLLPPMAMLSSTRQRRPWKTLSLVSCTSQHHPSRSPLLPLPLSYGFVRLKMAKCTFLIGIRSSRDPRIRPRALLQLTTPSRSGGGRGSRVGGSEM